MKKIVNFIAVILVYLGANSCADIQFGDDFLGTAPESSGAILDTMFSTSLYANTVLTKAYCYLPYVLPATGNTRLSSDVLESISDLSYSFNGDNSNGPQSLYNRGLLSASSTNLAASAYKFGSEDEYTAIRYAWIFIENVDKVPESEMSIEDKALRIAEAKMIIAISYFQMLRYVGAVPLLKGSCGVNDDINYPRNTFEECVEYIVQLLDEAIPDLPWSVETADDGRMTMAGAMALKTRVLLYAASPTYNSDEKWHPDADSYTCYGNYDKERWRAALDACQEFMAKLDSYEYYDLVQPASATHTARRQAFRSAYYDRGTTEMLISIRKGYTNGTVLSAYFGSFRKAGPTLNYVNMFAWENGDEFPEDFDWENPPKQPFYDNGGVTPTREPRLYETVALPGSIHYDGTYAIVHTNHPEFTLQGTGFLVMKYALEYSADRSGKGVHSPYLRLPEVFLNYAEAINEYEGAPNETAYLLVNRVRERVGLPDLKTGMNQAEFRAAVLKERALELGYEECRWFDLTRHGLEEDYQKTLYGLKSVADNGLTPTSFTFSKYEISDRAWKTNWNTKWYLAPIPQTEVNKGYGMTQNPGW